jgi:glycosyltransferase involved in cell wall biosynthesis
MSTYAGETAGYLDASLESLWRQTRLPEEVVLVLDGPVGSDQEAVLTRHLAAAPVPLCLVREPANRGLASALNAGLAHCRYPYVARMDSDDVCAPERLDVQFRHLVERPDIDVLYAWQAEFEDDPDQIVRVKTCPTAHDDVVRQLKWRCPISHPTVVFRRSLVERIGGYRTAVGFLEDYDLYFRLLDVGARFQGIPRFLVKVRVSDAQRRRRGGWAFVRIEWHFRHDAYRRGNLTLPEFLATFVLFSGFRISPPLLKRAFYRLVREDAPRGAPA